MIELAAAADAQPLPVADYSALPTDVLHDILLRLPVDEVCRLRLVCRSWRSLTSDPLFAAAHASRHLPHVFVVSHNERRPEKAEVRAVDLHGNVIKRIRGIRRLDGTLGPLTVHGDLLCVSYGWGLAYVVDMVTGAVVADMIAGHQRTMNASRPECVLGHVPCTGEYKVLRVQEPYSIRQPQTFEVVTLGGGARRRWRRLPPPPFRLSTKLHSGSGNVAVVAGFAYFLVHNIKVDSVAVFDLGTEEWKPATLQGPLSSRGTRSTDGQEEGDEPMPVLLHRKQFQLVRLGESLVMLYCNIDDCSTELWFMEDMDEMAERWSRRYTLQCTPFWDNELYFVLRYMSLRYYYPLAILEDGKILVSADGTSSLPSALRAYDPETGVWTDLATPTTGDHVVGMHRGSLLCSNLALGRASGRPA